jgi:hypothetical protein
MEVMEVVEVVEVETMAAAAEVDDGGTKGGECD